MTELQEKIYEIVNDDKSGGVKFTELISILVARNELKASQSSENFINIVLTAIKQHPKLEILEYTWHYCKRQKLFIYTP